MRLVSSVLSSSRALVVACAALVGGPVFAAPYVVTDVSYVHSAETTFDSHYYAPLADDLPSNWRSPIDYASGSAVVRLEVISKPSDAPTRFQVCFEATQSYGCTYQSPAYTDVGVYTWETPFSGFWSPSPVDWSSGIRAVALVLKDTSNGKPSPENVGAQVSARYMPTELRVTVTLVPPGEVYVPPEEQVVDAGPLSDDGGVDAGVSDDDDGGTDPVDAGLVDTGADAGAEPETDAGLADTTSDAGTGAAADPGAQPIIDAGVDDESPNEDALTDAGSAAPPGSTPTPTEGCTSTNTGSSFLALGALLALLKRRRPRLFSFHRR